MTICRKCRQPVSEVAPGRYGHLENPRWRHHRVVVQNVDIPASAGLSSGPNSKRPRTGPGSPSHSQHDLAVPYSASQREVVKPSPNEAALGEAPSGTRPERRSTAIDPHRTDAFFRASGAAVVDGVFPAGVKVRVQADTSTLNASSPPTSADRPTTADGTDCCPLRGAQSASLPNAGLRQLMKRKRTSKRKPAPPRPKVSRQHVAVPPPWQPMPSGLPGETESWRDKFGAEK